MNAQQLLTPRELALELGVSKSTAQAWADAGHLPCVKIGTRTYFQRPRLVAAGWLPPDPNSAARSSEDRAADEVR
jgi:excisionase family DNA binding protein